ncbi:hypothetical protein GOP47_0002115 [Adiantum capillus-veneris]|uniref:ZZ-type domain-containing protein n=1 Tax=Adiantum capillus-veneris TaxID=13818 RepID=A0A9D4ZQX3_ADICA|nr:hypothetical protein GOP47_0002115 [Adiantum capillus-veneris]
MRGGDHVHTLWLLQSSPYLSNHYTCHVCWEKGSGPLFHCPDCQFDVHVACSGLGGGSSASGHVARTHFSHFEHPLLLKSTLSSTDEVVCDCCGEAHHGSNAVIYRCNQCDFDLCAFCVRAPRFLLHISHPHILALATLEEVGRACQCDGCGEPGKGMMYRCTTCNFDLHVSCTRLPLRPMHILHRDHPLTLMFQEDDTWKSSYTCNACGHEGRGWAYECSLCRFHLHPTCGAVHHDLPFSSSLNGSLTNFKRIDSKVPQRASFNFHHTQTSHNHHHPTRSLSLASPSLHNSHNFFNRSYSSSYSSSLDEPLSPHGYNSHTYSSLDRMYNNYPSPRKIHEDHWNGNNVSTSVLTNALSSRLAPMSSRDVDALDRVMNMLRHSGSPPYS